MESKSYNTCPCPPEQPIPYACIESIDYDSGLSKGLLTSLIEFNNVGDTVKKQVNNYSYHSFTPFHTGVKIMLACEYPTGFQSVLDYYQARATGNSDSRPWIYQQNYLDYLFSFSTLGYQDYHILSGATETEYQNGQATVVKTTEYGYDMKDDKPITLTPSSVSHKNSKNEVYTQSTVFPYHDNYKNTAPYNTMITKNMLDYPIEEKTVKGTSQFVGNTRTSYEQVPNTDLILPKTLSAKYTATGSFESRITYNKYDSMGNPLYISKDDAENVVYLWSYNYQYPIAKIENANYNDVCIKIGNNKETVGKTKLDNIAIKAKPSLADSTMINNLRNQLTNAQVTTYTYKPLVGVETITDPRGVKITYRYDDFGRLQWIEDNNGKQIETYDYHYKN
ncbi:MAG: hypothetical protein LBO74_08055 [Candidatus Symbiothrix sp.]|jgi:YD repeat-containing protein|nr:hypothetical protein [Candidatus Symbiothrix sp.]